MSLGVDRGWSGRLKARDEAACWTWSLRVRLPMSSIWMSSRLTPGKADVTMYLSSSRESWRPVWVKAMGAYCGQKTGRLGASTGSKSNNNCVGCRAASIVYGAWLVSMRFVSHCAARCFYGREGQAVLSVQRHKLNLEQIPQKRSRKKGKFSSPIRVKRFVVESETRTEKETKKIHKKERKVS